MPKIVDHDERRQKLAEAVWRIILREGLGSVSVRKIASEADVSPGSLRHYFSNQSDLLCFSMNLVSQHVRQRIVGKHYTGESLEEILTMITELLPINDEQRAEGQVWLAFIGLAIYEPNIRLLRIQVHKEMDEYFHHVVVCLSKCCKIKKGIAFQMEAKLLHSLVDGLALHSLIHPELMTADEMISIVKHHLNQLSGCSG
jgi:AcrR family transcriptional regulator